MILARTRTNHPGGSAILPRGEWQEAPPGTKQFRLASLFCLLTAGALVAALCKWFSLEQVWTVAFEGYVVFLWWHAAQIRDDTEAKSSTDQSELRAEVRRWLQEREGR